MAKHIEYDNIISSNPSIDKAKLEKNVKQIEALDKLGVHNHQYSLLSPYCQLGASNKIETKRTSKSTCFNK